MISVKDEAVYLPVCIHEGGHVVKNLTSEGDKAEGYHLRHDVFCNELGWVAGRDSRMERDEYDDGAVSFGVFDAQSRLQAYLRLILPPCRFMIEKEFLPLIGPGHRIRKEKDTAEVSRLCVAPGARKNRVSGNFGIHSASLFLYKGVYRWCRENGIRHLYMVVERKVHRLLCASGFPCKLIGSALMPDGVEATAAIMDWREFEALDRTGRTETLRWFSQSQSVRVQSQQLQLEPYSRHRVFA